MTTPREKYLDRLARRLHRADYDIARGASLKWIMVHVQRLTMDASMLREHYTDHWVADHILARVAGILDSVETLVLEKIDRIHWNADASTEITYLSMICDAKNALPQILTPNQ